MKTNKKCKAALLYGLEHSGCPQQVHLVILWGASHTSHFAHSWNIIFYLKEQMTGKLRLFRLGNLADIFLKKMKSVCHFKENNWQYLLPIIKSEFSSKTLNPGKLCSHYCELDSFPFSTTFLMGSVFWEWVWFWYGLMWSLGIWMIWVSISQYLPYGQHQGYTIMCL